MNDNENMKDLKKTVLTDEQTEQVPGGKTRWIIDPDWARTAPGTKIPDDFRTSVR